MAGEGMTPEELKDWLKSRPAETRAQEAAWIASRAAARVLPVLLAKFGSGARGVDLTCLHACHLVLISRIWWLPEFGFGVPTASRAAAASATAAEARAAAASARAAAAAAALVLDARAAAAAAATANARAAMADVRAAAALAADAGFLSAGGQMSNPWPLWPEDQPADLMRVWTEAKARLPQGGSLGGDAGGAADDWSFWIDWYEDLLAGRPQNRALLAEIALIPDAEWKKGPAHVNAMIAEIVEKQALERSFIGEHIERDAEGLFTVVPARDVDGGVLANAVAKVTDRSAALRAAVTPDNNALLAILPVLDDLDNTVARYSDNPLRLHDDFREAHHEIAGLLRTGEVSPDRLIDRLRRSLETAALDCVGNSETCKQAVQTRVNVRALNLSSEDQGKLRAVSEAAQAESDAGLRRDLAEDLDTGLDTSQPEEKRANAMKREGSRLIRIKEKREEAMDALNDTAKTIKSADTVWDFVTTIWQWFF